MGSLRSVFEQQLMAAQNRDRLSDERAQQVNAAMAQMMQQQMDRDRNAAMAQALGNVGRDLYQEFTNRYVATPELIKKCPPPRKPEECKPHPKAAIMRAIGDAHIGDWMQPGAVIKDDPHNWINPPRKYLPDEVVHVSNLARLRAEVAAWTRRAA